MKAAIYSNNSHVVIIQLLPSGSVIIQGLTLFEIASPEKITQFLLNNNYGLVGYGEF